jgi:hypothetical protein
MSDLSTSWLSRRADEDPLRHTTETTLSIRPQGSLCVHRSGMGSCQTLMADARAWASGMAR